METGHLQEFVELSRQLNFTSTAKTLNISQPSLSNHIKALEREMGAQLVERPAPGGVTRITPAGQVFLETAKTVLRACEACRAQIGELERTISGKVVVRSPRNEFALPLLPYLSEYRECHPSVDVVLLPWSSRDGVSDVASGDVDMAYIGVSAATEDPIEGSDVLCAVFGRRHCRVWADRSDALAMAEGPLRPHDLDGRTFVIPANQKRDSWVSTIDAFSKVYGISVQVDERYCDSLEDFVMTHVGPGDLFLCAEGLASMFAFDWRTERVLLDFDPPLVLDQAVAYRRDPDNPAVESLARFLRRKLSDA